MEGDVRSQDYLITNKLKKRSESRSETTYQLNVDERANRNATQRNKNKSNLTCESLGAIFSCRMNRLFELSASVF